MLRQVETARALLRHLRERPSPQDVSSVLQRTQMGCLACTVNAFLFIVSTWPSLGGPGLVAWAAATSFINVTLARRSERATRKTVEYVTRRAARRLVLFSVLLAMPWGILASAIFLIGDPANRMMAMMVCLGTITGATFMLHRTLAACFAFYVTILLPLCLGCLIADGLESWPLALFAVSYGTFLVTSARQTGEVARQRDASVSQLSEMVEKLELAHDQISHLAYVDSVTGLANRMTYMERLEAAIADAMRSKGSLTVMMLDLDRFKNINDTMGHHVGDQLLTLVGKRLRSILAEGATLARLGGDEFALILPGVVHEYALVDFTRRIVEVLTMPAVLDGRQIFPGTSIGAARLPDEGADSLTLLLKADIALNKAKELGRGRFVLFNESLSDQLEQENWIEKELRRAIALRQITVRYQPKVDIRTGCVLGAEALVRWDHPARGPISPVQFLPVAAERGLLGHVSRLILDRVADDILAWREAGVILSKVAVNLHALDLRNPPELLGNLKAVADRGVRPGQIILEVTEGCFVGRGTESAPVVLDALDDLGYELSLDDFGTGYASLSHLSTLPVREIKIDRAFVTGLEKRKPDHAIVAATVEISRVLGLRLVAEGIETADQADTLLKLGVEIGQGYLWSGAVTPDEIRSIFENDGAKIVRGKRAAA
jgi:diguanylate cyclase